MSYYDPYYPTLEATRLQIQRSFMALQEKLRLQRQYDLNLDIQNADRLRRGHQYALAAQDDELRYREAVAGTKYLQANAYERQVAERLKYANEQESGNLRHLSKIQRLERQRLQLRASDAQLDYYERRPKSSYLSPYHGFEEDEKLLRKYEDGTRARELKDDLFNSKNQFNTAGKNKNEIKEDVQRTPYNNLQYGSDHKYFSNQKLSYLNNLNSEGKKVQNRYRGEDHKYETGQQRQPRFGEIKEAPRFSQNLRSNEGNKSARNDKYEAEDGQNSNQGRLPAKNRTFEKERSSKDLKMRQRNIVEAYSNKKKKQEGFGDKNKERSRSQKHLNISHNNPPGQSPFQSFIEANTDRTDLKPKLSSQGKNALDRSRNINASDRGAWEKIKKRLKCSYTTYRDSQFHNVKHELNHLFNTYDCESRLRKDIKMKINGHPAVLKKHAMVVQ